MNKTIYYEDGDDFSSQRIFTRGDYVDTAPVIVEAHALRVGNDTYNLAGVSDAKLLIEQECSTLRNQKEIKSSRMRMFSCGGLAIVGIIFVHYLSLLLFIPAIYYGYILDKARTRNSIQQHQTARLVLVRGGNDVLVVIGSWPQYFDDELKSKMESAGYAKDDAKRYNEYYAKGKTRAEAIAKAVGLAIVDGSSTHLE